jgi:hypothetical protein
MADAHCFEVPPRKQQEIEEIAAALRRTLGVIEPFFPLLEVVEQRIPKAWDQFYCGVADDDELGGDHGRTWPDEGVILLRSDVYQGVREHQGRDRFTLAHELGHLVLHSGIGMARRVSASEIKTYCNSEWQADAFGGALLIPPEVAISLRDVDAIVKACGVSEAAALTRLRVLRRHGYMT